jgi:hypothetical protein
VCGADIQEWTMGFLTSGGGGHPQPNYGVQLTASSVRCAPASGSS